MKLPERCFPDLNIWIYYCQILPLDDLIWAVQAGAPGFEPGQTVPKTAVLPLHHAPKSAHYLAINTLFQGIEL